MLWAVTPDGRATNRGVIGGIEGGNGQLETNYGQSQFALIVTAEPHFAVTIPSTMMVLFNVADDVEGARESKVTTLTERVDYARLVAGAQLSPPVINEANPLEVVQARYAIAIARAAGAERFSSDAYVMAKQKLAAAEVALAGDRGSERKTAPGLAREAVIAGEDARRAALLASTENATAERQRAAATAATNAANTTARLAATATAAATEAATATAATAAAASSEAASQVATDVERERAAVAARDELRTRLNEALPTRDSSRGLIAEIGGVQFATGTAVVNADGRESLSKFSGIVASYPGLRFNIEGHTDNTGGVAMNQELSLKRAMTVRDYLIEQGVPASRIDVAGLGLVGADWRQHHDGRTRAQPPRRDRGFRRATNNDESLVSRRCGGTMADSLAPLAVAAGLVHARNGSFLELGMGFGATPSPSQSGEGASTGVTRISHACGAQRRQ